MSDPVWVGVDVGGGTAKVVLHGPAEVIDRSIEERDHDLSRGLAGIVDRIAEDHRIAAVGVGIAGLVDHRRGVFIWGPHVSGGPVDIGAALAGRKVFVDNDANLAAYAEALAHDPAAERTVLTVSVGTGIGSGLVIAGSVHRGEGFAGEVGHMRLVADGDPCPCGAAGCWETLVSGRILDAHARRLGLGDGAEALGAAAERGDEAAATVIAIAGRWLGVGITNLVLAVDPSIVVVAGGVSALGDRILGPARERIASTMPGADHRPPVPIVASPHGRWAAAVGAASAARNLTATTRENEDTP